MNNFLEMLDINPEIDIFVKLQAITDNGYPSVTVSINNRSVFHDSLLGSVEHQFRAPLLEPIEITITMSNKNYSDTAETAVILQSVRIDDFEIIPAWTHLTRYHNDHGIDRPVSYLGYNGSWVLKIDEPFYQWHHRVTGQGWLLQPTGSGPDTTKI